MSAANQTKVSLTAKTRGHAFPPWFWLTANRVQGCPLRTRAWQDQEDHFSCPSASRCRSASSAPVSGLRPAPIGGSLHPDLIPGANLTYPLTRLGVTRADPLVSPSTNSSGTGIFQSISWSGTGGQRGNVGSRDRTGTPDRRSAVGRKPARRRIDGIQLEGRRNFI